MSLVPTEEAIRSPGAGIAGSCEPWVLGIELGPTARTVSMFNH